MDEIRFIHPGVPATTGQPGHNEFGVPLHACHGVRHDAHYWVWVAAHDRQRQAVEAIGARLALQ